MIYKEYRHNCVATLLLCSALLVGCDMSTSTIKDDDTQVQQYRHGKDAPTQQTEEETYNGTVFTVRGVKFTMIDVEGGTFQMGATIEEIYDLNDRGYDPTPLHNVTLSSYQIGQTEVTNELWYAIMDKDATYSIGCEKMPQKHSYTECEEFVQKLNNITGKKFRIPTEAEWEYAARGGKYSIGYQYAGSDNIDDVAWYSDNSYMAMDVALKNPNELELYDMSGNEKEWCMDYPEDYSPEAVTNPYILDKSNLGFHILRGGSISNDHTYAFVWFRDLSGDYDTAGLRLVLQTTDDDLQYY